jgi:RNA polymerase sigma-70 factor (ECF subfamily)
MPKRSDAREHSVVGDQELMALIAGQDEAALGELYDRYSRLVFSLAYGVVGVQDSAEEIALDVFTRVWEKAHTYRSDRAKVRTWLTRMTRNRAIDHLRRESVRPSRDSIGWAEVHPEPASSNIGPEAAAAQAIEKDRVRAAVASLSESQREVLELAYFGGYSHSQIARVLDLPLGTVKGRVRMAMQNLRRALQDEEL